LVTNALGAVYSLPAALVVSPPTPGGGWIDFQNQAINAATNGTPPVYDVDGVTPLNGVCVVQLYAGPSLALLRAVGAPVTFQTGFSAGYWYDTPETVPNVPPGSNAFVQVRAWDPAFGGSFEAVRSLGGKFGESSIFQMALGGASIAGMPPALPPEMAGLQSFTMQAGLPVFDVGTISFVNLLPSGAAVFSLSGQPNSIYLLEQAAQDWVWNPYLVLTNSAAGTVNFTNSVATNSPASFFRARILN
jgi:hypothetical protein